MGTADNSDATLEVLKQDKTILTEGEKSKEANTAANIPLAICRATNIPLTFVRCLDSVSADETTSNNKQ